jgi:hypothetical protein
MDIEFSPATVSGALFEEEAGLRGANFPNIPASMIPSVAIVYRAFPNPNTPTTIPIYNAQRSKVMEYGSMVFPQIEDDDMVLFYRNTELVQWLINGRVASLQDKLVTAVPLTATARDATHRLPTQDVIANFFNTQSMAAGLAGGGGAPASNLITRLARPQENIHCGTNAQPKATETDPWAQHDPWRSYHPVQQAHAVTGPTEGMQQIEERIQTAVLAKTQVPMEDDIPDRVQALEGQVHQLLAKQQGLEVQFHEHSSQHSQQINALQNQVTAQAQQLHGHLENQNQNMQSLFEQQMQQIRGLLSKRPRDDGME